MRVCISLFEYQNNRKCHSIVQENLMACSIFKHYSHEFLLLHVRNFRNGISILSASYSDFSKNVILINVESSAFILFAQIEMFDFQSTLSST